jgi:TM2 domain-containing membrane protein YozV
MNHVVTGAHMSSGEYETALMQSMTDQQRMLFQAEMMQVRKTDSAAILFALFLGGLGAHRFYLKDMLGIVYVIFVWTFIPMIVSLIECFFLSNRVERYNKRQAYLIAARIKAYTSGHMIVPA